MLEVETKVRRWGRSLGIVIPKGILKGEGIKADDTVKIIVTKKKRGNALEKTFGSVKFSKPTAEILSEGDKESWDE